MASLHCLKERCFLLTEDLAIFSRTQVLLDLLVELAAGSFFAPLGLKELENGLLVTLDRFRLQSLWAFIFLRLVQSLSVAKVNALLILASENVLFLR